MPEKSMIERSPVRVFDRAIGGGLGAGNIGVVLSRNGGGKTGFLIGLAIDKLLQGKRVLYISTKESVEHVNDFFDQIFHAMAASLAMDELPQRQLQMERNRHILVYNRKFFSVEKLENSVTFLTDTTGFTPDMVVMDGTPRFESTEQWELDGIRKLARQWNAEVWTSGLLHREGQVFDERGIPQEIARYDADLAVVIRLATENGRIGLKVLKEHASTEPAQVRMELDPATLLLRWQ
ncbi:MAG: hypothetical protein IPO18_16290 [bacterium]|jgi:hypothetical protein|nr:hypothetical protein [bacterium]MBK7187517.1 hypothetical protein [bacterium]MBK7769324.1 hypothetical protein [bacterium]MBK9473803.1 hypothetical protein [bacterium]MBK9774800.1 hypothetical protein [bacterium]